MDNRGQSLLEIILAMAIFAIISSTMISLSLGGFVSLRQGGEQTVASGLAQEGLEAVRAIKDRAWNELTYTTSSVFINDKQWSLAGEGTTENIDKYTRVISFFNVCRDNQDDIAVCPAAYIDAQAKKVVSVVVWPVRKGVENTVQQISYLTNWDAKQWVQTDWHGGPGQDIWSDITKYDSGENIDDIGIEQVQLSTLPDGGYADSGYLVSSAFDLENKSPIVLIGWGQDLSQCEPSCSIEFQVRTASNQAHAPGSWSEWYGSKGAGTYFTEPRGAIIPKDLNWREWVQYRVRLIGDGIATPVLRKVFISYQ